MLPPITKVERTDQRVVRIEVDAATTPDWEFWLGLTSDRHHDNAYCVRPAEKFHLDLGVERGAAFIDIGDWFCLMQGFGDPRQSRKQLSKELQQREDYCDAVVQEAGEFFKPYAGNLIGLSPGNHEWEYLRRHGTHVNQRFAERLQWETGHKPIVNTLEGWYKLRFHFRETRLQTFNIAYHHGYGGGGPVTKDKIQANRLLASVDGADFILFGHTHDAWHDISIKDAVTSTGVYERKTINVIKVGGYKDEHSDGEAWGNLKGHRAKPIGGWWVRFYFDRDMVRNQVIRMEEF